MLRVPFYSLLYSQGLMFGKIRSNWEFSGLLVGDLGNGGFAPDGRGVGTDTAQVRAERLGKGNGRVYQISFRAVDGDGSDCVGSIGVEVSPWITVSTQRTRGAVYPASIIGKGGQ